ncbi:MAG: cation:proton antiporter [Rhodoblastus sp.]|nr:MAG: cation:proton antiporter [Rhodoblastus sp.]
MADPSHSPVALAPALVFLGAAVVAVPLFRYLGLGATVGYLAAGAAIGPSGLALISHPDAALAFSELGVVMLLFLVGLELEPSRLIAMRREIVGLGLGQMASALAALAGAAAAMGLSWRGALVAGLALAYSATSVALQAIEERGALNRPWGRRALAILLFQDVSVAPALALIPLMAAGGGAASWSSALLAVGLALSAVALLVAGGLKLLNPFFGLLARAGTREVMTAGALLVVLGAAAAMEHAGLSMALGAFLAGLLLSESRFRHQLEADIEPFRGLLMGLFFLSVGMSIDGAVVAGQAGLLFAATIGVILLKLVLAFVVLRVGGSGRMEALATSAALTPAGEFSFVLFPLAAQLNLMAPQAATLGLAASALTMLVGPLVGKGIEIAYRRLPKSTPADAADFAPDGEEGTVLVIGFGRFGQIANQVLLAAGVDVTVIDSNVERIRAATNFGFKVFYGDGGRLDVLRAAGADKAQVIAICVDDQATATRIARIARVEFPLAKVFARSYDRRHTIELIEAGVDYDMRETFESALAFGGATVAEIDGEDTRAADLVEHIRSRDRQRLLAQIEEGRIQAGGDYVYREPVRPEPLTAPARKSAALNAETRSVVAGDAPAERGDADVTP